MTLFVSGFVIWKRSREEHLDEASLFDATLKTGLLSLLAGRLVYILFHLDRFGLSLGKWWIFWRQPGIHWLGVFLLVGVIAWRMTKGKKWPSFQVLDIWALAATMGLMVMTWGEFLGGSSAGRPTQLPIGVVYPGSVQKQLPVNLVMAILWSILASFLWWVEKKYRRFEWYQKFKGDARPGLVTGVFLICFGLSGLIRELLSVADVLILGISLEVLLRTLAIGTGVGVIVTRSGWLHRNRFVGRKAR